MKVYFVRHGESETNAGQIFLGTVSKLTEKGIEQANNVAKRFSDVSIDLIVSSTLKRAEATAEIIHREIKMPIEYSDFFVERRRPTVQIGKAKDNHEVLRAERAILDNFAKPGFRFSDEENFDDIKKRACEALKYLASKKVENILVVTHGFFMRIVMAYVAFGEKLTGRECEQFLRKFHMENTGITVLGYDEKDTKSTWWLWVWNDHA